MSRQARFLILALCTIAFAFDAARAQAPAKPKKTTARAASTAEADPLAEVRRTTAITLVNALADESRNFRDQTLRARVQARAADALWETDAARARMLFRRAWEAAEAADYENERRSEDERRALQASRGSAASNNPSSMRPEVLRLAARRDRALGEEFLAKMGETKKPEATSASNAPPATDAAPGLTRYNPDEPPAGMKRRMELASEMLEEGNVETAIEFGDAGLYPVNTYGVNFLDALRDKNAAAADQRYMSLLARAASDPSADANTASLLSSYVLTPYLYITFSPTGDSHTRRWSDNNKPPADVSPQLREAFFRAAAAILLRPTPPPEQDTSSTGRAGKYMVIARLAPLFDQYAPDRAPALRAQLAALQPDTPEKTRQSEDVLARGLIPEDNSRDRVQEQLDRLDRAKTADERDGIYFRAAMAAAEQKDSRAREFVDKIEDLDLRKQLRAFMDFQAVSRAIRDKNGDEALRLSRAGELNSVQRTWGITEAARLLSKSEPGRAIEMLEEALMEARRIDAASPDRVRALVAIVTQLQGLDRARAWEAMADVVKAANAASGFTGEDGGLTVRVKLKQGSMSTNFSVESFDLTGIFNALAKDDLNRAVELAKAFTAEYPRAIATLAVASTVLEKKK